MKRFFVVLVCFTLIMASLLSGCQTSSVNTKQPGEKTKLKIEAWGIETDPNSKIIKEAVNLFNEKSTTAMIEIEFTEQEQYKTKIATLMAANEAPDLFNTWAAGFLRPFVTSGKVYSISEDLDKDPNWKNSYINGIFESFTFDGKIYAAPTTQTVACLFYNKEIFDRLGLKAPETYSELKDVIKKLNDNDIIPFALGNKAPWVGAMFSELVANRIGGSEPFNKVYEGTGTWLDPSFIEAGNIMYELVQMNAFPEGFNALDNDPAQELFKEGKAAMLVMGSWAIQQLTNDESPLKGKVDVARFPAIEGGKGNINSWLGQPDQSFAISANCKNKEAAVEFLKTIASQEIQEKFAEAGNLVATKTTIDPSKSNPVAIKVAELQKDMEEFFLFYDVALGSTIGNEYNNAIQAITAGKDPEEAFKALQEFTEQNRE